MDVSAHFLSCYSSMFSQEQLNLTYRHHTCRIKGCWHPVLQYKESTSSAALSDNDSAISLLSHLKLYSTYFIKDFYNSADSYHLSCCSKFLLETAWITSSFGSGGRVCLSSSNMWFNFTCLVPLLQHTEETISHSSLLSDRKDRLNKSKVVLNPYRTPRLYLLFVFFSPW